MEARFQPRAGFAGTNTGWVTIGTSASFSGAVSVDGGWYDLEVRASNSGVLVSTHYLTKIGIGDIYVIIGQSNASNLPPDTPVIAGPAVYRRVSTADTWSSGSDPQPEASNYPMGATQWVNMANALVARDGVPIAIVDVAKDGSTIAEWKTTNYMHLGNAMLSLGTGFKAVLLSIGETDTDNNTPALTFEADLKSVIDHSRTDAGFLVPWYIATETRITDPYSPTLAAAEQAVADTYPGCHRGADLDTIGVGFRYDTTHFDDTGLVMAGNLWRDAL